MTFGYGSTPHTVARLHTSDEEFMQDIEFMHRKYRRYVDSRIADGARFIISASGRVHAFDCSSMRGRLDMRNLWPFNANLTVRELRDELLHGTLVTPLALATAGEINSNPRYKRCRVCCPDVAEKPPRGVPTTRAGAVNLAHVGRQIGGRAVAWIRLDAESVAVGLDDGSAMTYDPDDRIAFDPRVRTSADERTAA